MSILFQPLDKHTTHAHYATQAAPADAPPPVEAPPAVFSAVAPGWDEVHFAGDAVTTAAAAAPTNPPGRTERWRWGGRGGSGYQRFEEAGTANDAAASQTDHVESASDRAGMSQEEEAQAAMPAVLEPSRRAPSSLTRGRRRQYEAVVEESGEHVDEDEVAMLHAHTG